jgi:hypothetical protein
MTVIISFFSGKLEIMKLLASEKLYIFLLAVIFAGIVVHAPLSVWLGTLWPQYELVFKVWKELLMVLAAGLAAGMVGRRGMWRELAQDKIFWLIITYAGLHILLALFFDTSSAAVLAGLAIDLRYVLFFGLVYVALKALPQYRQLLVTIAVVCAFVVLGFATLQLFLPRNILAYIGYSQDTIAPYLTVDKNDAFVRVNSTLRGPNPLGAYAGMVLTLLAAALVQAKTWANQKQRWVIILLGILGLVALWISYSRSAWIAAAIGVGLVVAATVLRKLPRWGWIAGCIVLGALIGGVILGRDSAFVSNVLLHENPEGGSEISSNDQHAESLAFGLERLVQQPFGAGVGSTGSASLYTDNPVIIENQYLFIAHESGWLGLLLFIAIFVMIMLWLWRGRKNWLTLGVFASGLGLALIGFIQPVWVDDTVSIVWWGLAAIALAGGGKYASKAK